ncbi:LbtU family siderophore porin [Corallincola spongiicola]|uniref:LbtU family siderophore porin n=1 Tax=Corallincola spongiicola TaxID=2520508 RepID=A0ABY1WLT4_9GAMM|nr:LbtU family siderophore porin [Corallincola spongiicola]TAA41762.1 LbtU family siderophore porin [Corallincola spongiicola]
MNKPLIASAVLFTLSSGNALAADPKTEIERLKDRLEQLEKAQDEQAKANAPASEWNKYITVSGVVEVEAGYADPFAGDSESDIVLATAELGVTAIVHPWVAADIVFLYEEDETDLEVDVATVTIANPDGSWHLLAGKQYLPFGNYETSAISDPLTLKIGEILESAVLIGVENSGFHIAGYVFNGDLDEDGDNQIDSFGATAGYRFENDNNAFAANVGYINSIGDADALSDTLPSSEVQEYVGGIAFDATYSFSDFTLIGEYVSATDNFSADEIAFNGKGVEPAAWNLEVDYAFAIANMGAVAALAYQGTDEAVALELPESRIVAALSLGIFDNTALAFEYAYDTDYDESDGGTGENASTITVQLAYEF